MATLSLTVVSGLGTSTQTQTFSAPDASRILAAYQKNIKANGTQDDLTAWLGSLVRADIVSLVTTAETTTPAPPTLT